MLIWLINCTAVFILCIFSAGILIPQILLIAFRKQLFDEPDERKIHRCLVPRLGGIAFEPVVFFSLFLVLGINLAFTNGEITMEVMSGFKPFLFGFCAIILIYLIGIADDLIGVRYIAKFGAQILCGVMLIIGGIWIDNLHGVFGINQLSPAIGYPFTILLVVFIINAINLIDGIDGLASGLSGIACLSYGLIFFLTSDYLYAMLAFATLGVLVPFFYYNVFGDPGRQQKIFMGDTGSLTIGIILSFLSIHMAMYPCDKCIDNTNTIVLAFSPLFVPCCDVVRVYLYRVRSGKNPFLPDRNHIHHKLLAIGMRQRSAMVTIVSVTLALILLNIFLSMVISVNLILIIDILLWSVSNICLSKYAKKINKNNLDKIK